jgi:hypothetical protein
MPQGSRPAVSGLTTKAIIPTGRRRDPSRPSTSRKKTLYGGFVAELLGVNHDVVRRGIGEVRLIEVAHAVGLFGVVAAEQIRGGALVGRLAPSTLTVLRNQRRSSWRGLIIGAAQPLRGTATPVSSAMQPGSPRSICQVACVMSPM